MTDTTDMKPPSAWIPIQDRKTLAVLGKLVEELGECGQAAGRCIIHGLHERQPPDTGRMNTENLADEIADVLNMLSFTIGALGLDRDAIEARAKRKFQHIRDWMVLIDEHERTGPSPTNLEYTNAVGEAGHRYLHELVHYPDGRRMLGDVALPATFRWHELFERMLAAAA